MSPIENVMPSLVSEPAEGGEVGAVVPGNKRDRSRDLFGVQLEVTSLLLEAERRKLAVLQKELQVALAEGGSIKAKEHQKQELLVAISRIQAQYDHLDKEYREHALGALLSANTRGSGKKMLDPNDPVGEKPKISRPKPTIASKPKYIPPVNLKVTPKSDLRSSTNGKEAFLEQKLREAPNIYVKSIDYGDKCLSERDRPTEHVKFIPQHQSFKISSHEVTVGPSNVRAPTKNGRDSERGKEFSGANVRINEITKNSEKLSSVAPNSPSTVCCSILSNSAGDCCGIMGHKKELTSKSMTKIDSLDSNSSDSGGFKDFIQLDTIKKLPLDAESGKFERKIEGHQRKFSQPEFLEKAISERAKILSQSFCERKSTSDADDNRKQSKTDIGRIPKTNLVQNVAPNFSDKTDDSKNSSKLKPQVVSQGQFKQSTKKLEEILAQRLEKEKQRQKKMGMSGMGDGDSSSQQYEQQMAIQKQFQQKLKADLMQTVKQIQEIQSIELRLPQNKSWDSNRSQPAIGLKHTPKSRPLTMDDPEIQETVESILGKEVKIVDCEKKSSIQEEEVLLINGLPVKLEGRDGRAIKQALLTGQVPPCDLLNTLLIRTGILKAPVKLETSLSVKTSTVTKEEVTVARDGKIVDERSRETKENDFYTSSTSEVWEPVRIIPNPELVNSKYSNSKFSDVSSNQNGYETGSERKFGSCSSASSYESDGPVFNGTRTCLSKDSGHLTNSSSTGKAFTQSSADSLSSLDETDYKNDLVNKFRKSSLHSNGYNKEFSPTIFGTVASDLTPKDCSNRRSLPQTPQTSKNFSALYNGDAVPGTEHATESEIHQDNALVYRDGNLISGSLEALIQHMVPTDIYYPDRAYLFAFLLSSRLFIKPHELLAKVRQLCEAQQGLGTAGTQHGPGTARFAEHLVQLLAEWTETFPYDFRDERVMQHVRSATQQCMTLNQSLRSSIPILLQNLQQRLKTLEAYEKSLDQPTPLDENQPTDITEVSPNPSNLAQQLTHMELERLSFIGPEEFVQAFAKDNPHIETSFKDMKKTRNLEQYVQWFNRLSYFVATQVCKHPKKKQRVRVVEYWIETARECFNIGNFNSLMAIIAGLNMSPISRLKKTWNKIQSGKFSILEHQMDPSSNFSSYRSTLKAAMWRSAGATDQRQRIVIPFFSLLVKDLYFLNEGCSNKLPNGHINFEKFWQLAKQVTEFMAWKQVACPFEKDPKVIALLQRGSVLSENALALASFECEPPDNNQERERCKSLKAENAT